MPELDTWTLCAIGTVGLIHVVVAVLDIQRGARACCTDSNEQQPQELAPREESLVRQRLMEFRASYFQDILHVWMHLCGIFAWLDCARLLIGWSPLRDGFLHTVIGMSYITALVLRMCPDWVLQRTLWIVHSWYMALLMSYGMYCAILAGDTFAFLAPQLQLLRVLAAWAYPEVVPNLVWNSVWAAISIFGHFQPDAASSKIPTHNLIASELGILVGLSFMLLRFQQHQTSLVCSELDAHGYLRMKATMEKILGNMCDAVAELDRQLDIRQPCAKLAGLLIRPESARALRGEAFPSLFHSEEDRDRFFEFIEPRTVPIEQEGHAGDEEGPSSVYANLRDANGTAVAVQIFHSCHKDPPDGICHVVGVREIQEEVNNEAREQQGAPGVAQLRRERPDEDAESVTSSASTASHGSESMTMLAPVIPDHRMFDPVSAVINPLTFELLACTVGFKSYTGPLFFRGNLLDVVVNKPQFQLWAQQAFNDNLSQVEPEDFVVKMTPALAKKKSRFEFHAKAYILQAHVDVHPAHMGVEIEGDEDEVEDMLCVLVLRDVETRWLPARRERPRRIGRSQRRGHMSL